MALTEVNSLGIKDLEVKTADIAADAVTGAKIADDQIDSEHYVNASIDHAHLADDCVDGDNIADNSVGLAAMAHGTDGNLITFDASGAPAYVATGNDGQVLTSTGAGSPPAFETISTTDTKPFRNLVINGACNVAQRATSKSTHTGHGYFTVDRFYTSIGGENEGREEAQITLTSSDTGPWAKGFRNAFQVTNGNQTSTDAGDYLWTMTYYIEAQDVASSGWEYNNTSSYLTISFWVKSSVAQNFYGYFRTSDGTSKYRAFETGALSANTWTKITKSIPGHADIQIDNNTGHGFQIYFYGYAGTDKTASGVSLDTWYTWNSSETTPDWPASMDDWWRTDDATLAFTGLQVEVGDTATEFEHRSFGEELLRCLRYYEKSYPYTVAPGTAGDNGRRLRRICGDANNTTAIIEETYNVEKRATPTLTTYATDGNSGKMTVYNYGSTTNHQNASTYGATARGFEVNSSGNSMNAAAVFWQADAEF